MTDDQQWTIKRLLTWTTQFLEESGSPSPRLDAEVLLSEARECNRIALYTSYDEVPDEAVLEKFRGWIRQRAGGEPVAYLVGYREFYSLSFRRQPTRPDSPPGNRDARHSGNRFYKVTCRRKPK